MEFGRTVEPLTVVLSTLDLLIAANLKVPALLASVVSRIALPFVAELPQTMLPFMTEFSRIVLLPLVAELERTVSLLAAGFLRTD